MLIDGPECRLWVEVRGSGAPVTVFAHGITSSVAEIAPFAARAEGTRVLFDFRGHGRSESPEDVPYDRAAMRRDFEHVAGRFGATQAMGVSMGAGAILQTIAERPDGFARLVFFIPASIDEPPLGLGPFPTLADLLETRSLEETADAVMTLPHYQPLFARRPHWRRLVRSRILRMNRTGVPRALRAFAAGPPPLEDAEPLRAVTAPALVLSHEDDPIHPASVARRLASLLPHAELRLWPEPLAALDDVGEFARLVADFLAARALAPPGAGVVTR